MLARTPLFTHSPTHSLTTSIIQLTHSLLSFFHRRLLWHDFGLNEFYSGDGKTPAGDLEYIVPNVDNVKDLQDLKVLKLKPFE